MKSSSFERSALGPIGLDGIEPKIEAEVQNKSSRGDRKPVYEAVDAGKAAASYAPPQSTAAQPAPHNPGRNTILDPAEQARLYRGKGHG